MKKSELRQLIREIIEEEFARSPANQLDNILGNASSDNLNNPNFIFSSIVRVLRFSQFVDAKTVSDIRKVLRWRNADEEPLDRAVSYIKGH